MAQENAPTGRHGGALPHAYRLPADDAGAAESRPHGGGFSGLPEGVTSPGQLLAALKAAAPRLGISPRLVHAVDWLFRFTQPQDWEQGQGARSYGPRPRCSRKRSACRRRRSRDSTARLIELGLVTMKDSPNGKRYGTPRPEGPDHRGLRLRSVADRRAPRRICARWRRRGGRNAPPWAAAPAGDDRPQSHRPDPRDGPGIRLRGRGVADPRPRDSGSHARSEGRGAGGRDGSWGDEPGTPADCGARASRELVGGSVNRPPWGPENRPHHIQLQTKS